MHLRFPHLRIGALLLLLVAMPSITQAAVPSSDLLPATTKGLMSIGNLETLTTNFDRTQLGKLMADPVMKPFTDDLQRQLQAKWSKTHEKLGLTWDDLKDVPSGEIGMALVQPSPERGVSMIVADVTGKLAEADVLLAKVDKNLKAKQATISKQKIGGHEVLVYTHVKKEGEKTAETAVFLLEREQQQLVASDDLDEMRRLIGRFDGQAQDRLSAQKAFKVSTARVQAASGDLTPDVRWFVEPFGFVEAMRSRDKSRKPKGQDMVKLLREQGFDAVQGVAGNVNFYDGKHDVLHRTMVYAPAVERAPGDRNKDKYNLAARMLKFINAKNHEPPKWIPRRLATYATVNADLINGFTYSESLVNAMAGDEIFQDVIDSLKTDPKGPQVDLVKDLVANFGEHVHILSDYTLPISPKSERLFIAIELTNPEPIAKVIDKIMSKDRDAKKVIVTDGDNKYVVWEVVEREADEGIIEIDVEGGFGEDIFDVEEEKKPEKKPLPTSAMTVAHGYLITATHADIIRRVLTSSEHRETLSGSIDYQIVKKALDQLGGTNVSIRTFSRTDEQYRPTYELMRTGKMPESETMLGKMLNKMLGDDDDETVRDQQIDGTKLPEFQVVRRYLGPAGMFVESQDDGWFVTGVFLSKETPHVVQRNER